MAIINEPKLNLGRYYSASSGITTAGKLETFRTIKDRDNSKPRPNYAWVIDATADPTVDAGSALYVYTTRGWKKLYETESMDQPGSSIDPATLTVRWENVLNKPLSTAVDIDQAVERTHIHLNKDLLNKLGLLNGKLTYDGTIVAPDYTQDIATITNRLDVDERVITIQNTNITANQNAIQALQSAAQELTNQLNEVDRLLAICQTALTTQSEHLDNTDLALEQLNSANTTAHTDFTTNITNLATDLSALVQRMTAVETAITEIQTTLNGLKWAPL